jgi:hypothetical protein
MHAASRSKITEHVLAGLLAPHADFARKRVALLYRPDTPDESIRVAERDANTANFVPAGQEAAQRPRAAGPAGRRAVRQEVAAGAASIRFSLLVTVTVRYDGDLAQAVSTLEATLYLLSREGVGSVGPLVAALAMAVLDALEERATQSVGGRLPVPFVGVLDEAANICRIRHLDAYYSHFGSRGIILLTVLQSWAQGAEAWGDKGMEKLWSSANARIYGGGVDDPAFLKRLSDLIGNTDRIVRSASISRGRRTITRTVQERPILTPGELRELPTGRAVVFASGTPGSSPGPSLGGTAATHPS